MFNLRNVLELINDRFHNRTFTQQQPIGQRHQAIFHVAPEFGDKLHVEGLEEFRLKFLGQIAFIAEEFAEQPPDHLRHGLAIIHIARRQDTFQQFAAVVEHEMHFEAEEPARRGLATHRHTLENLVLRNASIMTNAQIGRIDERNTRADSLTVA